MIVQQASPQVVPLEARFHKLEVSYRWALTVAVIAVIALVGLAGWTAVNQLSQPKGGEAVTDLVAAWTTNDEAMLGEVYAADAVLVSAGGATYEGLSAIKGLSNQMAAYGFKAQVIGPIVQSGNTVVAPVHLTWNTGEEGWVTGIFELDAQGRVVHHQDYGTP